MSEQIHDHDHGHGHDHEHHHHSHEKTLDLGYATVELSSHMHEQAATVSATIKLADGQTVGFLRVTEALQSIANQSEAIGGIVGHIKGYAESEAGFAHASCTDAALGVSCEGSQDLALNSASKIQLVAIVMLVDLHDLEHIVIDALGV